MSRSHSDDACLLRVAGSGNPCRIVTERPGLTCTPFLCAALLEPLEQRRMHTWEAEAYLEGDCPVLWSRIANSEVAKNGGFPPVA